jgi:hypothetical protein
MRLGLALLVINVAARPFVREHSVHHIHRSLVTKDLEMEPVAGAGDEVSKMES